MKTQPECILGEIKLVSQDILIYNMWNEEICFNNSKFLCLEKLSQSVPYLEKSRVKAQ